MLTSGPLRVAVLSSHRSPGIAHLLNDPNRGSSWELAACITSENDLAERELIERAGVLCITHPIGDFHLNAGVTPGDPGARQRYDTMTAAVLERLDVDLVLLSSYLYVLTAPLLDRWNDRIVNLHDSDLTITDDEGVRRFVGLHSVRDALRAGLSETRVTAHLVTDELDGGPLLLRSEPFPVATAVADALRWGAEDILRACAFVQREWMMRSVWGEMLRRTIEIFVQHEIRSRDGLAMIDGMPVAVHTVEAVSNDLPSLRLDRYPRRQELEKVAS